MTDFSKGTSSKGQLDYDSAVKDAAERIKQLLKGAPAVIRPMTSHLAGAFGKMIRAKALLACALDSNNLILPDAVKAAAAIELIHLATLVHDDIIDNAEKRRGMKALHKKFGGKFAVLCGDWLLCAALELVSTVDTRRDDYEEIGRVFPKYMVEVCLGELRQNKNNRNYRLSEQQYFETIRGKTAALFEACFYAGYIFSGETQAAKDYYIEIGNNIGIIFQLSDDCADYEATQKLSKKPVLSDYTGGVVTLPMIYALKKDKTLRAKIADGIDPPRLKEAVTAAGGLDYTHAKIDSLYNKTNDLIELLGVGPYKSGLLSKLLAAAASKPTPGNDVKAI